MGNITQLKQGSLNGLRRQTNECIDNAYRKGYEDGKKEPREVANVEDTNEYQIGYKNGFAIGYERKKEEWDNELENHRKKAYDKGYEDGYTQAIADYRKFEKFFNSEGIEAFEDIRNTDGTISIDMILQYLPMPEIMARIKAYEEKKNEEIKVGDEVKDLSTSNIGVVLSIGQQMIVYMTELYLVYSNTRGSLEKTGRHFDEVGQLLDKLRGEEE